MILVGLKTLNVVVQVRLGLLQHFHFSKKMQIIKKGDIELYAIESAQLSFALHQCCSTAS